MRVGDEVGVSSSSTSAVVVVISKESSSPAISISGRSDSIRRFFSLWVEKMEGYCRHQILDRSHSLSWGDFCLLGILWCEVYLFFPCFQNFCERELRDQKCTSFLFIIFQETNNVPFCFFFYVMRWDILANFRALRLKNKIDFNVYKITSFK